MLLVKPPAGGGDAAQGRIASGEKKIDPPVAQQHKKVDNSSPAAKGRTSRLNSSDCLAKVRRKIQEILRKAEEETLPEERDAIDTSMLVEIAKESLRGDSISERDKERLEKNVEKARDTFQKAFQKAVKSRAREIQNLEEIPITEERLSAIEEIAKKSVIEKIERIQRDLMSLLEIKRERELKEKNKEIGISKSSKIESKRNTKFRRNTNNRRKIKRNRRNSEKKRCRKNRTNII